MLKMKHFIVLAIISAVSSGCYSPEFVGYNTEAGLSYASYSNNTSMLLMKISGKYNGSKEYAVVDCKDSDSTDYILITPTKQSGMGLSYTISNVDFSKAVTLKDSFAEELIKRVKISIDNWDNKPVKYHGVSYEYTFGKKNDIKDLNDTESAWVPIARYYFQNNSMGPLAVLKLGFKSPTYKFEFNSIEKAKDFYNRLRNAVNNHEFNP